MTTSPNVVAGSVATVSELGRDQAWLLGWLRDQPARLGLGDLALLDADRAQDGDGEVAFLAAEGDRYFSVDVRLGELQASHGFELLDDWARSRARHPGKTHVAVLVTESAGDRYRSTLQALAQHLPLVVIELVAWRGESEAIIVPHVALASDDVDLTTSPAGRAAKALARASQHSATPEAEASRKVPSEDDKSDTPSPKVDKPETKTGPAEPKAEAAEVKAESAEPKADGAGPKADAAKPDATLGSISGKADGDVAPGTPPSKDDTGVVDPWGTASGAAQREGDPARPPRLLTKVS